MTAEEQVELYAALRTAHPAWTTALCSGYVHGALDEGRRKRPMGAMGQRRDEYAMGYLAGFAVHRGSDSECESWFGFIRHLADEASE